MSEHKWEFGDWGREHNYLIRYVGMNEGMLRFIWPDGSTGRRSNDGAIEYLPDCTGWDWKPKPKYRPFADGDEFRQHRLRWWRYKDIAQGTAFRTAFNRPPVMYNQYSHDGRTWQQRFDEAEFEDGTPFGLPVSWDDK